MKTTLNGILTLLLALVVQVSFAQEKTISGTVSDQNNIPLGGVNILVQAHLMEHNQILMGTLP